jgi:3-hydroxybutyryl-CoA dehydrogenase
MRIFVTGPENRYQELKQTLPPKADTDFHQSTNVDLAPYDVIIDLSLDERPEQIEDYKSLEGKPVIASAAKRQLAEIAVFGNNEIDCYLMGLNALPTFMYRDTKEVSLWNHDHRPFLENSLKQLGWDYEVVDDRVGMVTPRVLMMIINEAAYTLEAGTASQEAIDISMKKGVNYPMGPFEWADKIGIQDVFETLEALYEDTKDPRYKICPLLKTKYFKEEGFWVGR